MNYKILCGESLEILKSIPSESVDSIVTDPPAGISLRGLEWDSDRGGRNEWIKWLSTILSECERALKPGAYGLVWAIPKTSHWTAYACEEAGFIVRDVVTHVFGCGFPKSIAIDKAILKAKYLDKNEIYKVTNWIRQRRNELGLTNNDLDKLTSTRGAAHHWTAKPPHGKPQIPPLDKWSKLEQALGPVPDWLTALIKPSWSSSAHKNPSATREETRSKASESWKGWGTALKPASEHWILIQKPISEHSIAANILKHGTGGINIDASRIRTQDKISKTPNLDFTKGGFIWDTKQRSKDSFYEPHPHGRFPSNFMLTRSKLDDCPAQTMNKQSGIQRPVSQYFKNFKPEMPFFYSNKLTRYERDDFNEHPTVKPLRLMRYLCKMITPPNGTVLDPFMGSGSTGVAALFEGCTFIGIEKEETYFQIAEKRLKNVNLKTEGDKNGDRANRGEDDSTKDTGGEGGSHQGVG